MKDISSDRQTNRVIFPVASHTHYSHGFGVLSLKERIVLRNRASPMDLNPERTPVKFFF